MPEGNKSRVSGVGVGISFADLKRLSMRETAVSFVPEIDFLLAADNKGEADQPEEMSERLMQALEDGVQEIFDKGIIVRDVDRGLVDFPTQREGREVFLCWVGGEETIDFWHETDRGFAHRQPL